MNDRRLRLRSAFTLIELLLVITIIAIVTVLSTVAIQSISDGARLSSARNTVVAAMEEARATAIRTNRPVAVVFSVRWDPTDTELRQRTVCQLATWFGDQVPVPFNGDELADIFVPVKDSQPRALPEGMKVAGPFYAIEGFEGAGSDFRWLTQPELRYTDPDSAEYLAEYPGEMVGILFDADGTVRTSNSASFAREAFLDLNGVDADNQFGLIDLFTDPPGSTNAPGPIIYHFNDLGDEAAIQFSPFLSVYDDDEARGRQILPWTNRVRYDNELAGPNGYITQFSDRININRYTGRPTR